MRRALWAVAGLLAATTLATTTTTARADMWCAWPLFVHEWGVHVFRSDGSSEHDDAEAAKLLPPWFHTTVGPAADGLGTGPGTPPPVHSLPADTGVRRLPVVHFWTPGGAAAAGAEPVPIGFEVGFAHGPASMWFPQVDVFRTVAAPRQLSWNRLVLTVVPKVAPKGPTPAWVAAARQLDTLWVNGARESDKFLFYEAQSSERVPLTITRERTTVLGPEGPSWLVTNRGARAVHDVFIVQRDASGVAVVFIADLAPGKSQSFTLGPAARVAPARLAAATSDRLRSALLDPTTPDGPPAAAPTGGNDTCVTGRKPSVAFETSQGHRLYRGEVDLVMSLWDARFFGQTGTTIVYREDEADLDEAMPLSIYTSMFNYVVLQRAGLALWEHVTLP